MVLVWGCFWMGGEWDWGFFLRLEKMWVCEVLNYSMKRVSEEFHFLVMVEFLGY